MVADSPLSTLRPVRFAERGPRARVPCGHHNQRYRSFVLHTIAFSLFYYLLFAVYACASVPLQRTKYYTVSDSSLEHAQAGALEWINKSQRRILLTNISEVVESDSLHYYLPVCVFSRCMRKEAGWRMQVQELQTRSHNCSLPPAAFVYAVFLLQTLLIFASATTTARFEVQARAHGYVNKNSMCVVSVVIKLTAHYLQSSFFFFLFFSLPPHLLRLPLLFSTGKSAFGICCCRSFFPLTVQCVRSHECLGHTHRSLRFAILPLFCILLYPLSLLFSSSIFISSSVACAVFHSEISCLAFATIALFPAHRLVLALECMSRQHSLFCHPFPLLLYYSPPPFSFLHPLRVPSLQRN